MYILTYRNSYAKKFDPKAKIGIFVGYDSDSKAYRIYRCDKDDVDCKRDVIFRGELKFHDKNNEVVEEEEEEYVPLQLIEENDDTFINEENGVQDNVEGQNENAAPQNAEEEIEESDDEYVDFDNDDDYEDAEDVQAPENEEVAGNPPARTLRRRTDIKWPIIKYADYHCYAALSCYNFEPVTYSQALKSSDAEKWVRAMNEEIAALKRNKTWILVNLPKEKPNILDSKWVFKIKRGTDDVRFKARLVARGFLQREGIDYKETFSPVARYDSVRMLFALAAHKNLKLRKFDVTTAFLNGHLEEVLYMKQPEGYDDGSGKVLRLKKSLYGLKQASKSWNDEFVRALKTYGFEPTKADPCVFVLKEKDGSFIVVVLYVDDGAIGGTNEEKIDKFLNYLGQKFEITQGPMDMYLGIEIERFPDGSIFMHQNKYILDMLEKFKIGNDLNPVTVPADKNQNLSIHDEDFEFKGKNFAQMPYREAIGRLLFLSMVTRPDISLAVGAASQFCEKPKKVHWNAVKRIFKYILGTTDYGLWFKAPPANEATWSISAFSDSDYAGDETTRKSTTGYIIFLGDSVITWGSRKQNVVALSTTEAEYIAGCTCVQELVWVKRLIRELLCVRKIECILYIDNQSAIQLIKKPVFHRKTKHIEVRFHYIRDMYLKKKFTVEYINTDEQAADIFTKPLARDRYEYLRDKICIVPNMKQMKKHMF